MDSSSTSAKEYSSNPLEEKERIVNPLAVRDLQILKTFQLRYLVAVMGSQRSIDSAEWTMWSVMWSTFWTAESWL